jgi:hypothetical protein
MTLPTSAQSEDQLPPSRIVRWVVLAGIILFSVGLFFRYGLNVPPIGTVPPPAPATTAP